MLYFVRMAASLQDFLDRRLAPALPGWRSRLFVEEREGVDVHVGNGWEFSTVRAHAAVLLVEDSVCVRVIGLRATEHGVRVGTGVLVRAAYFFADEVPAAIDDTTCIARNRTPLVDRPYALDEGLAHELLTHVVPWFARIQDEQALLAVLDEGEEFERVTAALVRIRAGDPRGAVDLRHLHETSRASAAWKASYRAAAARLGVDLPELPVGPPVQVAPPSRPSAAAPRCVHHAVFGHGVVRREFGTGRDAKLEIEFDDHGRKILLARFVEDIPF